MFQRTHVCHVQIDSVSDASRLLDLEGLAVDRVELGSFGGRVVHVVLWSAVRLPQGAWYAPGRVTSLTEQGFYG